MRTLTPISEAPPPEPTPPPRDTRVGWLEERLELRALYLKYGRKVFPVHATFFLGEIAAFSFLILVITGVYLGLIYTPSNVEIDVAGQHLPQAYASVLLIESIPVASLFRTVHHWAAHVMLVAVILHALPYDAFAVTATGIGYALARSIPVVGGVAADIFFGGTYPTLGSLPRLYTIHVVIVPALIALLLTGHVVMVLKQKHTQPAYARPLAEPGGVLGVPFWPLQALLAGQLLLLLLGGLFVLAAFVPVHPLQAYGPPGPQTPDTKPDWYLLWIYGFLKLVPNSVAFSLGGLTVGPEFVGGVLFPALIFGLVTLTPWLDHSNRGRSVPWYEYLEPVRQAPLRFALGLGLLAYLGMLFVAAYYDALGLSLWQIWLFSLMIPVLVGAAAYRWARWASRGAQRVDPTGMRCTPLQPMNGVNRP